MADQQIKVVITTDATGAVTGIQNYQKELAKTQTASASLASKLKENWVVAGAAIAGAMMAANKAMELMTQGAQALQQESSFKIMADEAGVNAERMIASMKAATKATIDDSQMMQKATKLMLAGYNPEQIERFSKVAIAASQYMGTTVSEAFDRVSDALASKMPKAMVQAGAITKQQMTLVNDAIKGGADSMELFNLAMANLELKQLRMQGTMNEATIAMQRFKAEAEDTKENIGKGLMWLMQRLYGVFQAVAAGALALVAGFSKISQGWYSLRALLSSGEESKQFKDIAAGYGRDAKDMMGASTELAAKSQDNLIGTAEVNARASKSQIDNAKAVVKAEEDKLKAFKAAADGAKEAERLMKKWEALKPVLQGEIDKQGMTEYERKLQDVTTKAEKYRAEMIKLPPAIKAVAYDMIAAAEAAEKANLKMDMGKKIEDMRRSLLAKTSDGSLADTIQNIAYQYEKVGEEIAKLPKEARAAMYALADLAQAADIKKVQHDATKQAGEFYGGVSGYEQEAHDLKIQWFKEEGDIYGKMMKDRVAGEKWASQQIIKYESDILQAKLSTVSEGFASLSGAMTGISEMYATGSKDAEEWKKASEVMLVAQKAVALVQAIVAVATQAEGDPYTAFARVAAMGAAMVALLSQANIAFSGSNSGAPVAEKQTSTLLGAEAGTESKSIENSLKMLKDTMGNTFSMEELKLTKIYNELKDLNNNITGIVSSIARTGGISNLGVDLASSKGNAELQYYANHQLGSGGMGAAAISILTNGIANTPLGAAASKLLGPLIGNIFGGGIEQSISAQGINIGASVVGSILNGAKVTAQQYVSVLQKHDGGWFSDDWYSGYTVTGALDQNVTDMFTLVFKGMGETLVSLAEGLGTDVNAALNYVFAGVSINLMGMSSDAMNNALTAYFSAAGDNAVQALFGDMLAGYQKLNEGLMETAVRLITDKAIIENMIKRTNQEFIGTTKETIAFSEALINMAGDLSTLTDAVSTYYDAFFTDAEKMADIRTSMEDAFASMDISMPKTRGAYKDIVEGLDLMTASGQQTYVTLMQMAEASDKYYSMLDAVIGQLKSARESMKMEGLAFEKQQTVSAQLAFQTILEQARQGNFANTGGMDSVLSTLTSSASSTSQFATRQDYQANFYKTYNSIAEMEGLLGGQIPIAEQQLAVLQQIATNTDPNAPAVPSTSSGSTSSSGSSPSPWAGKFPSEWQQTGVPLAYMMAGTAVNPQIDAYYAWKAAGSPAFASGGSFGGGYRMVGENGAELEYTGKSSIFSSSQTKSLFDSSGLIAEIKQLREELYAANNQIAINTGKAAKIADRWDIDGLPAERTNV